MNVVNLFRTATVDISVVPLDAKITINGKNYDNNSSYNVFPKDNVKVEISHPQLETKIINVDLKKDNTTSIRQYLVDKDKNFSYYTKKSNKNDLAALRELAEKLPEEKELQSFIKNIDILEVLPLTFSQSSDDKYNVVSISIESGSGRQCNKENFCLIITDLTGKNTDLALDLIRQAGFDPDDYEKIFETNSFFMERE